MKEPSESTVGLVVKLLSDIAQKHPRHTLAALVVLAVIIGLVVR